MAWTIGTAEDHGDVAAAEAEIAAGRTAARRGPLQRARQIVSWLLLIGFGVAWVAYGVSWAWAPMVLVAGLNLVLDGLAGYASARPPAGGPAFAIERLREGPVEVVGRVVPPKQALLSPLTSTKCSYFAYVIRLLDEATGEKKILEERSKLCDFWLKDVTGSIWVRSEGIDVRLGKQLDEDLRTYDQTPRAVGEHLRKLGVDPFLAPGVRRAIFLEETRLDPGDNVLVKGAVMRDPDGKLVIGKPPGGTLSVERWSKPTFVARPPSSAKRRVISGAVMIVLAVAGLVLALL
ncbi:MAG TPA: GIDE domain-containing protein [Planctomycetota bacterium]|nr:GIDE domain-containing protein [Planctomycetota bacterium]